MSNWDEAREAKLKELWEKGHTASQIAKIVDRALDCLD